MLLYSDGIHLLLRELLRGVTKWLLKVEQTMESIH